MPSPTAQADAATFSVIFMHALCPREPLTPDPVAFEGMGPAVALARTLAGEHAGAWRTRMEAAAPPNRAPHPSAILQSRLDSQDHLRHVPGIYMVMLDIPTDNAQGPDRFTRNIATLNPHPDLVHRPIPGENAFSVRTMDGGSHLVVDRGALAAGEDPDTAWFLTDHGPDRAEHGISANLPYWLVPQTQSEVKRLDWLALDTGCRWDVRGLVHPVEPRCESEQRQWPAHQWVHRTGPGMARHLREAFPHPAQGGLIRRECCANCGRVRDVLNVDLDGGRIGLGHHAADTHTRAWVRDSDHMESPVRPEREIGIGTW